MKRETLGALLVLLVAGLLCNAADPVPSVLTIPSQLNRVVIVRLKNNTDLLDGLKKAVEKEKIKNGVFLSGAGSLTSYHVHAVSNTTFPSTNAFTKGTGPWDLLTVTGYVLDGRVHAHITIANTEKAFGGHLEPGSNVFTFAIITVGILDDKADLKRFDDWRWE